MSMAAIARGGRLRRALQRLSLSLAMPERAGSLAEAEALDRVLERAPLPSLAIEAALAERIVAAAQRSPRIVKIPSRAVVRYLSCRAARPSRASKPDRGSGSFCGATCARRRYSQLRWWSAFSSVFPMFRRAFCRDWLTWLATAVGTAWPRSNLLMRMCCDTDSNTYRKAGNAALDDDCAFRVLSAQP